MPDGVYDVRAHRGWGSVGVDHDPPAWAVATRRAWGRQMGSKLAPEARERRLTADRGGRHSPRARLGQLERQRFADESGLGVCGSHLPPGTSPWHTLEPRRCCHITATGRGQPLESLAGVVSRMGDTHPSAALRIPAALDAGQDPQGLKGSAAEMKPLQLDSAHCHGAWNDTILPHRDSQSNTTIPRQS